MLSGSENGEKKRRNEVKKYFAVIVAVLLLAITGTLYAARPAQNVVPKAHPNLAAAQRLSQQAYDKLEAAQKANEWDMGGHAAKAKELLVQASAEIKLAAEAANNK
jgi:hypothetical protein